MSRRSAPRALAGAVRAVRDEVAPATPLAAVEAVWAELVGPAIAAAARPVAERDGVLVVGCESSVWADQLDLMQADLLARLRDRLGERAPRSLRCVNGPAER